MSECYFSPPRLSKLWGCSPETVLSLIRTGRLRAFTLSPWGCKRPRWRIPAEAVREYEAAHAACQTPEPRRSRKRRSVKVKFYT